MIRMNSKIYLQGTKDEERDNNNNNTDSSCTNTTTCWEMVVYKQTSEGCQSEPAVVEEDEVTPKNSEEVEQIFKKYFDIEAESSKEIPGFELGITQEMAKPTQEEDEQKQKEEQSNHEMPSFDLKITQELEKAKEKENQEKAEKEVEEQQKINSLERRVKERTDRKRGKLPFYVVSKKANSKSDDDNFEQPPNRLKDIKDNELYWNCKNNEYQTLIMDYFSKGTEDQILFHDDKHKLQITGKQVQDLLFNEYIDPVFVDYFTRELRKEKYRIRLTIIFSTSAWKSVDLNEDAEMVVEEELCKWSNEVTQFLVPMYNKSPLPHWTLLHMDKCWKFKVYDSLRTEMPLRKHSQNAKKMKEMIIKIITEKAKKEGT